MNNVTKISLAVVLIGALVVIRPSSGENDPLAISSDRLVPTAEGDASPPQRSSLAKPDFPTPPANDPDDAAGLAETGSRIEAASAKTGMAGQLQGIALPIRDAELRFPVGGTVTAVHVREGQWVEKGTLLVSKSDGVAQARVAAARQAAAAESALRKAELSVQQARSLLDRTIEARQQNASTDLEVVAKQYQHEQALAEQQASREALLAAQATLQVAVAQLEELQIRAPFPGMVMRIAAKVGNAITADEVAVHVADPAALEAEMYLPFAWFGKIEAGDLIELTAHSVRPTVLKATAVFVSPVIEPTSRTFRVRFHLSKDAEIPAGVEVWLPQTPHGTD